MTTLAELGLPGFDPADTSLHGAAFHEAMTSVGVQSGPLADAGACDVVDDLAKPCPAVTIAAVMGAGRARIEQACTEFYAVHPEQWALLAREPERVPAAVEEVLRHEPITPFTARITTRELTSRDVVFPAGTVVMVGTLTADRDSAGEPGSDITARREGARLEEAPTFFAPRMPGLRLAGDPLVGTVQGIEGMERLPVAWNA